ncbi:hypothetical protein [Chlamydia sp. 17-3921]|uniref:hypothetical protein n=1 Tax=Chlamydia sp. 17-3921 TaxID=2675798 RepID=UPI001F2FF62A|nr:hypothetical protein [Chlamydia sp. 17-3921]
MRKILCCSLILFSSSLWSSEGCILESPYLQKKVQYKLSNFWQKPEDIKEFQYNEFLKKVIHALGRPDIWNDPQNLLHILSQFRKFPEETDECREIVIHVIRHRIVTLLTKNSI